MTACTENTTAETGVDVKAITASEAAALWRQGEVVFVDPRPAEAIAATTGLIPGARIVALADVEADDLPADLRDRTTRIVTACQAGPMGAKTARAFARLGFGSVAYVDGGTRAWIEDGHPTVR